MHLFGRHINAGPGLLLLIAAGITLYIASRAAADALVGGRLASPGRMAIGHWIPIAAVALGAMVLRRSEIALGVIFATSVASLSLALGSVTFLSPPVVPVPARRTWPMVLPVALLAFLAGLRGELTRWHALVFLVQGVAVAVLWNDRATGQPIRERERATARWFSPMRFAQFALAGALAVIGAWCAVRGADVGSEATRVYTEVRVASAGLIAATLLGPLLVLPVLGAGVDLAHRGQSWLAVSSQVGVVLLNLCLLLPAVVLEGQFHPLGNTMDLVMTALDPRVSSPDAPLPATMPATTRTTTVQTATDADLPSLKAVPLPLAVWRVDIVVLIALGLFLVPVALGRWSLTKGEGLGLIGGYIAYLLLSMALGVRLV